jgi:spore germination protein GerM
VRRALLAAIVLALAATAAAPARRTANVWLLRGEHGVPVRHSVPALTPATAAVRALLAGPSPAERRRGLASTIPSGTRLRGISLHGRVATIDLTSRYASGGGTLSMTLRLAQLVYTATSVRPITGVLLHLDGRDTKVFGGEGLILDRPMTRASFPGFAG